MTAATFLQKIQQELPNLTKAIATEDGNWVVKGFIDVYKQIYTISLDTKVISKILEIILYPKLLEFAEQNGYTITTAPEQNFYPDLTIIDSNTNEKHAIDIKSTYRISPTQVNGMTLGAFTGYFRNRNSTKNIVFPYNSYSSHLVLGVIYTKTDNFIDERELYKIEDLATIKSVIRNFQFFVQPKYKIASTRPGSGNTKNIGSVTRIEHLVQGNGPFSSLGEEIYDDYWMYYLTEDMRRALDLAKRPYNDLQSYIKYKQLPTNINIMEAEIAELEEKENENDAGSSTN